MPAQSAAGLLPRTRRCAPHARHPHRIPGDTGSPPAIRWGCRACGPSRIRRPAPRPGHIGRQAEQGGLASGADRGNPGKGPAALQGPTEALRREQDSRVGRLRRACRTPAALPIAARGRACPKGPENGLGAGSCADASAQSAMRHRMRRRKGGRDVREPQGDDVAQAGRDHEAQEQGCSRCTG